MTHEQLSLNSEAKSQQEAETDVLVRKVEALVLNNDLYELRMAVRVASRLPHFRRTEDGANTETVREQTRREVMDDLNR